MAPDLIGGFAPADYDQAPQYRGEYSTELFSRKAIEWAVNNTQHAGQGSAGSPATVVEPSDETETKTFLYLGFQAVHGPIEAPPRNYSVCSHIRATTRRTYCMMMQALDEGIANITHAYEQLGRFDDTLWLFLADNGGMPGEGGFNVPLRGHKATVWEGRLLSAVHIITYCVTALCHRSPLIALALVQGAFGHRLSCTGLGSRPQSRALWWADSPMCPTGVSRSRRLWGTRHMSGLGSRRSMASICGQR